MIDTIYLDISSIFKRLHLQGNQWILHKNFPDFFLISLTKLVRFPGILFPSLIQI